MALRISSGEILISESSASVDLSDPEPDLEGAKWEHVEPPEDERSYPEFEPEAEWRRVESPEDEQVYPVEFDTSRAALMHMYMCKEADTNQYIYLYFTDTFMKSLVAETNRCATKYFQKNIDKLEKTPSSRFHGWTDVSLGEMKGCFVWQ